jgi:hypothetical protein
VSVLKLKGVLSRKVAAALRRMREGPLPEVSEVDWSEWEQSVAAWDDSATKQPHPPATAASSKERARGSVPDAVEADWTVWEESVQAIERARRRRSGGG